MNRRNCEMKHTPSPIHALVAMSFLVLCATASHGFAQNCNTPTSSDSTSRRSINYKTFQTQSDTAASTGDPLTLRYIDGAPTLDYNLLSGGTLRLAAADILGRELPLIEMPLTSTRGSIAIPNAPEGFPLLFYVVSVGDDRWVMRAISKP